jgi:hypothetical protein
MSNPPWHEAFLGVGALLGEPLDESLRALGGGVLPGHDDATAGVAEALSELLGALRSPSRPVRAHAIARVVTAVAVRLDEMRLR